MRFFSVTRSRGDLGNSSFELAFDTGQGRFGGFSLNLIFRFDRFSFSVKPVTALTLMGDSSSVDVVPD